MKKQFIISIGFIVLSLSLFSQGSVDNILSEVKQNNTQLIALQKSSAAQKLGNKTGIYLENPEVEFHYLWSNPSSLGNRTDISIKQSFDFPSAYNYSNKISNIKNHQVDLEYRKQLNAILLEAKIICFDLIYVNALKNELLKRLIHARTIASSYETKYKLGIVNILEYNKAQLNLLNLDSEFDSNEIERNNLLSKLAALNGGIKLSFDISEFQTYGLETNFEEWYIKAEQNSPLLEWLKQEVERSALQEKLNKAMSFPKIQAGYMSEKVVGQQYQGLIIGLSIPLWENKNTVKMAKANTLAFESIIVDRKLMYYNQLKALHSKAVGLQKNSHKYRTSLESFDNSSLLEKALDKGEISLIEYMLELSIYYKSVVNLLELERDMNLAIAELNKNLVLK